MEDSIKDLFGDIEESTYGFYAGMCVINMPQVPIDDDGKVTMRMPFACSFYIIEKTVEDIEKYKKKKKKNLREELDSSFSHPEEISVTFANPKLYYCVIANQVDYDSQDILQDNFSFKQTMLGLKKHPLARKTYAHYYPELIKIMMNEIGTYSNVKEFHEHLLEDLLKANELGYVKESVKEDIGIDPDKYEFCVSPVSVYEDVLDDKGKSLITEVNTIYIVAKNIKSINKYKEILINKLEKESFFSFRSDIMMVCYSAAANSVDYDSQEVLQKDYVIADHIKSDSIDIELTNKGPSFLGFGLYSNVMKTLVKVGIYMNPEVFKENYFEDMVTMAQLGLEDNMEECCCAGGMGGGVTTASFAPAVTHTMYPKPGKKKKKKSKKEDNEFETIDDIYGFYSCTLIVWLKFPGSDTILRKYYVVFGKDLDQIDKYNQIINNNIKQISKQSQILSTTLSDRIYSVAAKDFDFDSQKVLDPSLYVDNPKEFITSESIIQNDINDLNSKLITNCTNNLSDFFDNLFSQMTEDTDDVYWPVRNDETDAFEKMIKDSRKAKKEKIIARKERAINKRDETLFNWLRKMAAEDNYSTIAIHEKALKYNAVTDKMRADLNRIKRLPLDSSEFSPK